jgi:hypothetical protein
VPSTRVATVRWRKIFLRMAPVGQTSLASSAQDSDVRTKHLLSIPFTRCPLLLRLAVPCHERAPLTLPRRALASTCSHVPEPSQPSLSSAGIKGPYALASCPPPAAFHPLVSRHVEALPYFSAARQGAPLLTISPSLLVGPGALPSPRATSRPARTPPSMLGSRHTCELLHHRRPSSSVQSRARGHAVSVCSEPGITPLNTLPPVGCR